MKKYLKIIFFLILTFSIFKYLFSLSINKYCNCDEFTNPNPIRYDEIEITGTYSWNLEMFGTTLILDRNYCFHQMWWDDLRPTIGQTGIYQIKSDTLKFSVNCYNKNAWLNQNKNYQVFNLDEGKGKLKDMFIWKDGKEIMISLNSKQDTCISTDCIIQSQKKLRNKLLKKQSSGNIFFQKKNKN